MPVTYQIDHARRLIRTRCVGAVTLPEVLGHFHTLQNDPQCPEKLDVLLDLSEITSLPDSDQLRAVTHKIESVRPRVRFGACAIVAGEDPSFGIARTFAVFAEWQFRVKNVFRTHADAEQWLAAHGSSSLPAHDAAQEGGG